MHDEQEHFSLQLVERCPFLVLMQVVSCFFFFVNAVHTLCGRIRSPLWRESTTACDVPFPDDGYNTDVDVKSASLQSVFVFARRADCCDLNLTVLIHFKCVIFITLDGVSSNVKTIISVLCSNLPNVTRSAA